MNARLPDTRPICTAAAPNTTTPLRHGKRFGRSAAIRLQSRRGLLTAIRRFPTQPSMRVDAPPRRAQEKRPQLKHPTDLFDPLGGDLLRLNDRLSARSAVLQQLHGRRAGLLM